MRIRPTAQRRALLAGLVAEVFADSHETYGYQRVHAALLRRGGHCSSELVRALVMRERGLTPLRYAPCQRRMLGHDGELGKEIGLVHRAHLAVRCFRP